MPPDVFSFSNTRWGWTAGVGSEWALRQNVTFKSEILYMNFGDQSHSFISDRQVHLHDAEIPYGSGARA